ncbi:hypothetical protein [Terribacillus saccharophilus]|uniref:hypothetical protein n=1 Tax=Terribacillus saccharophilus TaxID=361277 RepID=UPI002989B19E|nr:hypothetical protein [Terribacillus saccharophilus]MCM3227562.1 hypothetical protein [Terribacillus saccharophilus]
MSDKNDVRRKIGIKGTFAECYETVDKRFVRVFEVSSVNLSLANKEEKRKSLESFRVFMNTLSFLSTIQFSQIAQPINLNRHLEFMRKRQEDEQRIERNDAKALLSKGYLDFMDDIQKSKDLVTRKRYVIISQKIGSDRDKALEEIDQKSKLLISRLEAMVLDGSTINVKQLDNEELTKLMYTCVDYDNSVSVGEFITERANNRSQVTLGVSTAEEMMNTLKKQLTERVN